MSSAIDSAHVQGACECGWIERRDCGYEHVSDRCLALLDRLRVEQRQAVESSHERHYPECHERHVAAVNEAAELRESLKTFNEALDEANGERARLRETLESIAANTCCD